MRNKLLSLVILVMLLASAACAPTATATPAATEAPAAPVATEAPTEAPEPVELTVMAAASLTESFTEIGSMFESANPGVTVTFNFAGSQTLAEQLAQGAEADVFASASKKYMTAAIDAARVNETDSKTFAMNRLVVVYPKDNPAGLETLADLSKAGIKIDLADESVPVGTYSLDFLDKAATEENLGVDYKDKVLANVVSYEDNVKAVVTKVSLDEADAGIVYISDITQDVADKVGTIDIPDAMNTIATYPIGAIADSKNAETAQAFVDFVLSAEGQDILAKYNFIPAANSFSVTDAMDRTITFDKAPTRVVVVGKSLFMVADAIYLFPEAGTNIVAIGATNQGSGNFVPMIDATYDSKILLDSNAGVEDIAAVQPDLVIMKSLNAEKYGDPLEQLGIPVVYLDFETAEQYKRDLATLGQLFKNPAKAEELAAWFQGKVDMVSSKVAGLTDDQKPSALIIYYNEKEDTISFNVPPMTWMQTFMVETAGGTPVWADANPGSGWATVNVEQIAAWNPDMVFIVSYFKPVDEVVAKLKEDPQWQLLDAVKNDKIYAFPTDAYSWDQPDPRWALGLEWVALKLHPELFTDLDIITEAKAFYSDLYGMDDAAFEEKIAPILIGDVK